MKSIEQLKEEQKHLKAELAELVNKSLGTKINQAEVVNILKRMLFAL